MENFYFTFGSDPEFPYGRDDYVLIKADDVGTAVGLFRAVHPNRPKSNCLNCAFMYNEAQWELTKQYYIGVDPIETISIERKIKRRED